jgi:hypothetical protein
MRARVLLVLAMAFGACSKHQEEPPSGMPALANPPPPTSPSAASPTEQTPAHAAAAESPIAVQGRLLERIDQGTYSYLRIQTASGEEWAAVPQAEIAKGTDVGVTNATLMHDFESKTLNRKWPQIWFGTLAVRGGAAAVDNGAQPPHDAIHAGLGAPPSDAVHGHGAAPAPSEADVSAQHALAATGGDYAGDVKVPKAEGPDAHTVGELWQGRAALKDKPVVVRGKVVKFNGGVMGRNWIHVRDGSGGAGTNDLTVTSSDEAAVGDVVTVKGTLHVDKDFGAGYAYPVIVEQSTLAR